MIIAEREAIATLADALREIGDVPAERIRWKPAPGTAVEADVAALNEQKIGLFELVDGVLVEKGMGFKESRIAALLVQVFGAFLEERSLGIALGADGMVRLAPGLVRIPDVSVILWDRLPGRRLPDESVPDLAPHLAVEVLSASNTRAEMARKVREYFAAGVRAVWLVNPASRSVRVHRSPRDYSTISGNDLLRDEVVLPGFSISVADVFRRSGLGPA